MQLYIRFVIVTKSYGVSNIFSFFNIVGPSEKDLILFLTFGASFLQFKLDSSVLSLKVNS